MDYARAMRRAAAVVLLAGAPASAQCELSTSFAGSINAPDGGTVFFDVEIASLAIEFRYVLLNVSGPWRTPFHIEVFSTPDSFSGKELDPSQWTRRATANGRSNGQGQRSSASLSEPLTLNENSSHGIAIVMTRTGQRYEDGNGSNEFFENDDLSIRMGAMTFGAFGPSVFLPRVWNGAIGYRSHACGCPCSCDFDPGENRICGIFDFLVFQNAFIKGEVCACDFDTSTGPSVCDIFDFVAFQDDFVRGCQ